MKLVTFTQNGGVSRLGALKEDQSVIDLNQANSRIPADMIEFLKAGVSALELARTVIAGNHQGIPLSSVKLQAPVPNPGKIICIGLNYSDHAAESGQPIPEFPVVFSKYSNTVIAHGDSIVLPKVSTKVDYEAELGFVIGKRGRNISEADALQYVAGYLPINDVSARDYQNRTSQWTIGKTFDTFAPMGPALVTSDEVGDPHNLKISLTIGDKVYQNSSTSFLIFNIPQLVASLSEVMTLEPGDVVSTGTPPGVGFAQKPPRFLQAGDVVSVTIEKLGTLTNPVVGE
ncbi:MAG: fumarylacetoacetate hydrolase family protein [Burkholderiales bacterium]|nr:fumarylacetoacetate hydrolase family protein [Anaerolineae bacterium]